MCVQRSRCSRSELHDGGVAHRTRSTRAITCVREARGADTPAGIGGNDEAPAVGFPEESDGGGHQQFRTAEQIR